MLEVSNLCKHYGGIKAVDGASFTVEQGSITRLDRPKRGRQDDGIQLHQPYRDTDIW